MAAPRKEFALFCAAALAGSFPEQASRKRGFLVLTVQSIVDYALFH